ncbi:cleft lip and palate associated transmembrane protein [Kwoniella mangroviensis CBS 10435]|uniref:Cleft lip and palate associated transmembrane protein n=1 Tax=Kwoniella mangroviensis CBS 10435 TaxID=1331196 RepID=A0A1B9IRN3_9TREE|nr:cleft lip and palate associated transmembrane protein [Kwoniella mangroviensis CBS 10435]
MSGRAAGGPVAQPADPARQQGNNDKIWGVVRSVAMFVAVQAAMKYGMQYMGMGGNKSPSPPVPSPAGITAGTASTPVAVPQGSQLATPAWDLGTPLSMLLYTSTSPSGRDVDLDHPLVQWDGLTYGEWKDEREADLILDVPESVWAHNGSWFMDVVLVKGGGTPGGKGPGNVSAYRKQLTRFFPKRRIRKEKKLIGNKEEVEEDLEDPTEQSGPAPIVAHWSNNLTLTIVASGGEINFGQLSPVAQPFYTIQSSLEDPTKKVYPPPIYPNDFWIMKESLYTINETTKTLPLHVTYHAISAMKFNVFSSLTASFEQAAQQQGGGGMEFDEIKRTLTETSPWLLITTAIVTVLHTLFEFLAFSSDVSHWRKKDKDLVGVSLNTILTNCFVQLVILLYLHDSSEETSFMILFGQGIGLLIEAWKITKVTNIRIRPAPASIFGYTVQFEDKRELSEDEKKTQEYDALAFRLVSYGAIPLLAGHTVYSPDKTLLHRTHRGWYSFIVTTLAQAIYMFGFVQLVPQLIINYKLKSVAHMPMKAMMYKTLSTVVDDFFAFCIRMPWLHRLACFRDDVVFLILIYQRWIYRVDYSRVNEYGQVNESMVEDVGKPGEKEKETKKNK